MSPAARSVRLLLTVLAAALLAVALQLLAPGFALAAEPVGAAVGGFSGWDWVGLVLRLGLVLVAIWAAVLAMRWYVRRMNGEGGGGHQLQVLESRALGPNRSLHLVRLADRAVLLGVTAERISALLTVDDAAAVERLAAASAAGREGALRQVTGSLSGLAGASLRGAPWRALLRRLWPAPRSRAGARVGARSVRPPAAASGGASLPGTPAGITSSAAQRARVAAAYGREASIAAAQRAIADARGADGR